MGGLIFTLSISKGNDSARAMRTRLGNDYWPELFHNRSHGPPSGTSPDATREFGCRNPEFLKEKVWGQTFILRISSFHERVSGKSVNAYP